jgi:hypothetical protein
MPAVSPYQAVTVAGGIAVACLVADLTVLSALGRQLLTAQPLPWALAAVAATASLIRVGASGPVLHRLLRTRTAVGHHPLTRQHPW